MEDQEEVDLNKVLAEASQLKEMLLTPGWKIYSDRITVRYDEAIKDLINKENEESRIRIKVIGEFMQWPKRILAEADQATRLLKEQQEDTETGEAPV